MSKYLGKPGQIVGVDIDANGNPIYPRGYQPGVMVGEDVDGGVSNAPHSLMQPGVMVGADVYPRGYKPGEMVGDDVPQDVARQNSDGTYTPGFVDVPGKGRRYQTKDGRLFHNQFGPALTQLGNLPGQIGGALTAADRAYTKYYDSVADSVGSERRDGSKGPKPDPKTKPKQTPKPKNDSNFVAPGINPKTNKPWTETPGKSRTEEGATLVSPKGDDRGGGGGGGSSAPVRSTMKDASELERYRAWVGANKGLAMKVKPGQAGYEEIQQILGNTGSASPATIQGAAEDAGRTKEDMSAIMGGGLETVFEPGKEPVTRPLTGRNTSAPNLGDIPQSGTSMGGMSLLGGSITPALTREYFAQNQGAFGLKESDIKNGFSSVALPNTLDGQGQIKMVQGGIQLGDGQVIDVDEFYGRGNNAADGLDQTRALGFIQDPSGVNFQYRRTK